MPTARIYQPDKNAMQSGKGKTKCWLLEFEPDSPYFIDGLMGWTGMKDTKRQLHLEFPTQEAAEVYAKKNGIAYEVLKPQPRKQQKKAYADNFKYDRRA